MLTTPTLMAPDRISSMIRSALPVVVSTLTLGKLFRKLSKTGNQEKLQDVSSRPDVQLTLLFLGGSRNGLLRFCDLLEDAVRVADERFTGFRQVHVASLSHKQHCLEFILEELDLAANGGMRDVKSRGSIREPPELRNSLEHLELANVHISKPLSREYP